MSVDERKTNMGLGHETPMHSLWLVDILDRPIWPPDVPQGVSVMRVICAWCDKVLQIGEEPTSHGICEDCADRVRLDGSSLDDMLLGQKITSGGEVIDFPPKGSVYGLEELQSAVDGYIDVVYLSEGLVMVLNEEGKLLDLPTNVMASLLWGHDPVVGDVVVCAEDLV